MKNDVQDYRWLHESLNVKIESSINSSNLTFKCHIVISNAIFSNLESIHTNKNKIDKDIKESIKTNLW